MVQSIVRDASGVLRLAGAEPRNVPTGERLHVHGKVNRWSVPSHGAIVPEKLYAILRQLERGFCDQWIDLAKYMVRTDGRIRGLVQTRINAVASAPCVIEAGHARPGDEALADEVAQFTREEWDRIPDSARLTSRSLAAVGDGWAAHEHQWAYEDGGIWRSYPKWIHPRDVSFSPEWDIQIRDTRKGDAPSNQLWFLAKDHQAKFIVHIPGQSADWPQMSGELLAIAWDWLFSRWIVKFRQNGLERFANPTPLAHVPAEADGAVVNEILEQLEQLSATHAGVLRGVTKVDLIEATGTGEAWTNALNDLRVNMAVSYLGSDLNTAAGTVGAYALGTSQFATTMLPRFRLDAKLLGCTMIRDWARFLLDFNRHLFGGRKNLPMPTMDWEVAQDSAKPPTLSVQVGGATIDEVRAGDGLEARGPELGGDRIAVLPQAPAPAGFSTDLAATDATPPRGADSPPPFPRAQLSTIRRPTTATPTESDLMNFARKLSAR